jgi:hypothetical protein
MADHSEFIARESAGGRLGCYGVKLGPVSATEVPS